MNQLEVNEKLKQTKQTEQTTPLAVEAIKKDKSTSWSSIFGSRVTNSEKDRGFRDRNKLKKELIWGRESKTILTD